MRGFTVCIFLSVIHPCEINLFIRYVEIFVYNVLEHANNQLIIYLFHLWFSGRMNTNSKKNDAETQYVHCVTDICVHKDMGVIDLNLPPLPEEEYPLSVQSICLYLFQKTLYHLPRREAEDGRGLR